jgi:hypothetical protein
MKIRHLWLGITGCHNRTETGLDGLRYWVWPSKLYVKPDKKWGAGRIGRLYAFE